MKKETLKGTGIQGVQVSFSLQELIVMADFQSMLKVSLTGDDVHSKNELIDKSINFFDKILEGVNINGLFEAHEGLFGEKKEKEL